MRGREKKKNRNKVEDDDAGPPCGWTGLLGDRVIFRFGAEWGLPWHCHSTTKTHWEVQIQAIGS